MTSKRANKFKKISHHLKSKQIDEKLEMLNEVPTNTISTLYVVEPEYQVQDPDIQGLPRGVDFTQDALVNGRDTTGLFLEDGTILTIEPPDDLGDKSFILGPMASMWYAWGNFSTIGYIRQSDRRMVDLGRITGQLENWNGSSGFTSYGQLTLAQANWFRTTPKYDNYRAFYPGPPSNTPDQYGRYYCVVTGTPKPTTRTPPPRRVPPTLGGPDSTFAPGSANPDKKKNEKEPFDMKGYLDSLPPGVKNDLLNGAVPFDPFIDGLIASLIKGGKIIQTVGELGRAANNWFNKGRNERIPDERNASWRDLARDDAAQRGQSDAGFARGDKPPLFGRPDQAFNPWRSAEKGGPGSGPTPLGRRVGELVPKPAISATSSGSGNKDKTNTTKSKGGRKGAAINNSYDKSGIVLSESHQKIFKNLKKPYQLPEEKKEKIKHRPRVIGSEPRMVNSDLMKKAEVPSSFKKAEERVWTKYNKQQNARWSQERKNEILDHLGGSDHAWEWLTETSKKKNKEIMYGNFGGEPTKKKVIRQEQLKGDQLLFIVDENGNKENILQSELSIKIADEMNKELFDKYFQEQETIRADKDPLFRKIKNKLNPIIDYPDKPSKLGYPNDPPPETINGWHPEYGQKGAYYNKLDPQSADAMPTTGNPEIDIKVKQAKTLKKVLGKRA